MDKNKDNNLYNWTLTTLIQKLAECGEPSYRGKQIFEWVYVRDVADFTEMTNLPNKLRDNLSGEWEIRIPEVQRVISSPDGTEKMLLKSSDSSTEDPVHVESVLMPSQDRMTLCVSSQSGCLFDCKFCATATVGFRRNLTAAEIMGQIILSKRRMAERNIRLQNIMFMGMGEPLMNFDALCTVIANLTDKNAMGLSPSRITVSTSGVADRMTELSNRFPVNIAVSLAGTDDAFRKEIMPRASRVSSISEILESAKTIGRDSRKPITFEYVLIRGVTDLPNMAKTLIHLLSSIRCKVNLIPYNPFPKSKFQRPETQEVLNFQKILWDGGMHAYVRWSHGLDVNAACGQLAFTDGETKNRDAGPSVDIVPEKSLE